MKAGKLQRPKQKPVSDVEPAQVARLTVSLLIMFNQLISID